MVGSWRACLDSLLVGDVAQGLTDLNPLTTLDSPSEASNHFAAINAALIEAGLSLACRSFEHEHDATAQLETAHLFATAQRMTSEDFAGLVIGGLTVPRIRFTPLGGGGSLSVGLGISGQGIGAQFFVEIDDDGANICGTDWSIAEKAVFPAAEKDDTFVEGEEAGQGPLDIRAHRVEFAGEMAALRADPGDGRMEPVVIAWSEVNHHVVEFAGGGGMRERRPPGLSGGEIGRHGSLGGRSGFCGGVLLVVNSGCGGGSGKEVGQSIRDAVHVCKFMVAGDGLGVGVVRGQRSGILVRLGGEDVGGGLRIGSGSRDDGTQERVDAVGHAFDLFNFTVLNGAKLQDASIGRREDGIGVGVQGAAAWFKLAIEEGGQVGEDVEVWFGNLSKVDTEDPAIKFEAWNAEVIGDCELVETAPDTRDGLERQSGHDLDLPSATCRVDARAFGRAISIRITSPLLGTTFSSANTEELQKAQEGNAQADGNGFPIDFCLSPCFSQSGSKGFFLRLFTVLAKSRVVGKGSPLCQLQPEVW